MLWRRFLVRSDSTLADLHVVFQIGFDWTDFHPIVFAFAKRLHHARLGGLGCHDTRKIKLADLHFRINERYLYETNTAKSSNSRCGSRNGWSGGRPVLSGVGEVNGLGHRRIAGKRKRFGSARGSAVAGQRVA